VCLGAPLHWSPCNTLIRVFTRVFTRVFESLYKSPNVSYNMIIDYKYSYKGWCLGALVHGCIGAPVHWSPHKNRYKTPYSPL
jgi:hypothetical protein